MQKKYTTITKLTLIIPILHYLLSICVTLIANVLGIFISVSGEVHFRKRANYYLSYGFMLLYCYVMSAFLIPVAAFRPRNTKNQSLLGYFVSFASKVARIEWHVRNEQNMLPDSEAGVIVSNHQSIIDAMGIIILTHKLKIQYTIIARNLLFWFWPVGLLMWLNGIIFINRTTNNRKTYTTMDRAGQYIRNQKIKLWIFPEGTRNKDPKNLLPFKKGAFRLAIENRLPITPIVYSPYYFIDHNARFYEPGKMIMDILPPIKTEGLTLNDLDALIQKTYSSMMRKNTELRKEFHS